MSRKRGAPRRVPVPSESLAELREELAALKEENARLRSEQQRPLHIGRAAAIIRDQVTTLATRATDDGDDAWAALTATTVLRETLVAACRDLETAIHHVHVQLTTGIPSPQLDRRRTDQQGDRQLAGGEVVAPQVIETEDGPGAPVEVTVTGPDAMPEEPVEFELEWLAMIGVPEAAVLNGSNGSMNGSSAPEGSLPFEAGAHDDHTAPQHGAEADPGFQPGDGPAPEC